MLPITSAVNGNAGVRVRRGRTAAGWLSVKGMRQRYGGGSLTTTTVPADVGFCGEMVAGCAGSRRVPAQRLYGAGLGCCAGGTDEDPPRRGDLAPCCGEPAPRCHVVRAQSGEGPEPHF